MTVELLDAIWSGKARGDMNVDLHDVEDFYKITGQLWAPTGTYTDALEMKMAIRDKFISRTERVGQLLSGLGQSVGRFRAISNEELVGMAQQWANSVADNAALVYLDRHLVSAILESSKDIPEIESMSDIHLPPAGLVTLGAPIPDIYKQSTADDFLEVKTMLEFMTTGLSWDYGIDHNTGKPTLAVTPWTLVPAIDLRASDGRLKGVKYSDVLGPLMPSIPSWLDGDYPRDKGFDQNTGEEYGWSDDQCHFVRFLVALAAWMESVAKVEETPVDRTTRKRAKRAKTQPQDVTYVKLRKLEEKPWNPTLGEDGLPTREYSHRWVVSGHWRQQPCGPRLSRRRPVYIAPHIAGPPDKPLVYKQRIWKVDR